MKCWQSQREQEKKKWIDAPKMVLKAQTYAVTQRKVRD